ncbi:MAG: universal stress protein [Dehalococcoidia bacterium]
MNQGKPVVLVTYDGSEVSKTVFAPAARLAKLMNAGIVLVQVLRAPPEVWSHPEAAHRDAELARLKAAAQAELDALAADLSSREGVEAAAQTRMLGERWNVSAEILTVADEVDAETICMATHGEGGIRRLFLGSTSQEVISESRRPVTLIRAGHEA